MGSVHQPVNIGAPVAIGWRAPADRVFAPCFMGCPLALGLALLQLQQHALEFFQPLQIVHPRRPARRLP